MKKVVLSASMIVAAIIGVGFVSGKEVVTFFARFEIIGVLFALFAGVCFGLVVYYFLLKSSKINDVIFSQKTQNCTKTCEKPHQNMQNLQISVIFQKILMVV